MNNKNYYVYGYIRLDTNTYFYIGKGKNRRQFVLKDRSMHFMNILNKVDCVVEILHDNLTEEEAFQLEEDTIYDLVFNEGYSIEINNNLDDDFKNYHLVNCSWGGEGSSGYHHKKESREKMSKNKKGKYCGENNHWYGKSPSEETRKKMRENHADFSLGKHPEAKSVICLTTKRIFTSLSEASQYYNCHQSQITRCCYGYRIQNGKKINIKTAGKLADGTKLKWKFLVWKHNKIYKIKKESSLDLGEE